MKKITFLYILLFTAITFAQQGINYKAIIKDNSGNVIANQFITVRFSILKGDLQTLVYSEIHTPTTDANGLIIVNIGEGTPSSGVFNTLDWGSTSYKLKVEVDTGSGSFVNLGTTEFQAVPYALNVTGLEQITENGNTGWRLKGRSPLYFGNIGNNAIDLSYSNLFGSTKGATGNFSLAIGENVTASGEYSKATGLNTIASGDYSIATGNGSQATGNYSTAIGSFSNATGSKSIAIGNFTHADGIGSTAIGASTNAIGFHSTAMGYVTKASSFASFAVGSLNVGGGSSTWGWLDNDPLFEIGNGLSEENRSNALTVLKNGKVGIGTATPKTFLHLTKGSDASLSNGTGYFLIGEETSTNMVFDNNEIMVRNNGGNSSLYFQQNGGNVYVGGVLAHSSDRRLKKDISPLSYGLETILKLNPVEYNWINRTQDHKSLGLIAQEVQPIISEIVHTKDDEAKTLSVSYTELIPILIKAIQEQQDIIENQQKQIDELKVLVQTQLNKN